MLDDHSPAATAKTASSFSPPGKNGGNTRHKAEIDSNVGINRPELSDPIADLPDPVLSVNAITVLERRYLAKDLDGGLTETPKQMFWRVASAIASNERRYNPEADVHQQAVEFYNMMASSDFLPNSPTMMNAGRSLGQLAACFVLPVDDTMEGIFEAVKQAALVHKSGGGTGFSFSRLRPMASKVASTAGTASGPVSFMSVFNAATETIKQGGTRRGANMGILRVDHPDIRNFITCKADMVSITNFNISVTVTDRFMEAVEKGEKYDLIAPHTGEAVRREDAREIFDLIAENAWQNGDPGVVFIDEVNRHEKTPHIGLVEATNPCGEQPLLPYESCNLGSINLDNMLTADLQIDWERIRRVTRSSVRFLDNIIDLNRYPVEQIAQMTRANRRIGLGVMGFADMLYALRIPYNSEDAIDLGQKIQKSLDLEARAMSDELAVERGAFPNCEGSVFDHPTRNSTVTTIAPTGTISMIADVSGGIEPNFALGYVKRVMDDDRLLYINSRFEEAAKSGGFYNRELMEKVAAGRPINELAEVPDDIKRVFVTSHDITPEWHIRMQAAFQKYCDNAVSKTINFPHHATVEDVKKSYIMAWKSKCKGITIYRDGSRSVQVMNVGNNLAKAKSGAMKGIESKSKDEGRRIRETEFPQPFLRPRHRPRETRGVTEQITTGEGTLYLTINEDEKGLCEVFVSIGKHGGTVAAQSEAIGRLISLALRSGIDPEHIIKQLKGITGPTPVWHEGELIRSTPDAIGRALERYIERQMKRQAELPLLNCGGGVSAEAPHQSGDDSANAVVKEMCPDCNSPVIYEEGCLVCKYCGYSKCE